MLFPPLPEVTPPVAPALDPPNPDRPPVLFVPPEPGTPLVAEVPPVAFDVVVVPPVVKVPPVPVLPPMPLPPVPPPKFPASLPPLLASWLLHPG